MKKTVIAVITGLTLISPALANKGRLESAVSPIEAFNTGFNNAINNYNGHRQQQNKIKTTYKNTIYSICSNHVITDDITKHNICTCFSKKLSKYKDINADIINKNLDDCIGKYSE